MAKTMYYRKLEVGEGCSKCGRPMILVALEGKVFLACLRCTSRELVSRTSELKNRNLLRENR